MCIADRGPVRTHRHCGLDPQSIPRPTSLLRTRLRLHARLAMDPGRRREDRGLQAEVVR